jgi:hypothetical protein
MDADRFAGAVDERSRVEQEALPYLEQGPLVGNRRLVNVEFEAFTAS